MGLANVVPGRYTASIVDWGVREVEKLDGAIEAWIKFEFKDQADADQSITWKGLLLKKDGERNKNTFKTLETCGLKNEDVIAFMEPDGLDTQTQVDITIGDEEYNGKLYKNVQWVNPVGGGQINKPEGDEKMSIQKKLAKMGMGKIPAKKVVKNHAPGASNPPDDEPEINF